MRRQPIGSCWSEGSGLKDHVSAAYSAVARPADTAATAVPGIRVKFYTVSPVPSHALMYENYMSCAVMLSSFANVARWFMQRKYMFRATKQEMLNVPAAAARVASLRWVCRTRYVTTYITRLASCQRW